MSISQVQRATSGANASPNATATFGATPTNGNLLVAFGMSTETVNPTDGQHLTISGWTPVDNGAAAGLSCSRWFYKIASSTAAAVTLNDSDTGALNTELTVFEWSSTTGWPAVPLDKQAVASNASNVTSLALGPTATTTRVDELVMAGISLGNGHGGGVAWTNSFSTEITGTRTLTASRIVTSTAAYSTTGSWTTARAARGGICTFTPGIPATLAAPLGGLTATASATVTVPAVLASALGALTATAAATPKVTAVLAAALGALTGSASATPTVPAVLSAALGTLTASATAARLVSATLVGTFGALVATAVREMALILRATSTAPDATRTTTSPDSTHTTQARVRAFTTKIKGTQ